MKLFSFFEHEKLILTVLLFRAEITVSTVANLNIQISDGFPAGCALIRLEMSRRADSDFWRKNDDENGFLGDLYRTNEILGLCQIYA